MFNIKSFEKIIDYFNNIESNNSLKFELKINECLFNYDVYCFFKNKYNNEIYKFKYFIEFNLNDQLNLTPNKIIEFYLKQLDNYIIEDIQSKSKRCFIFDSELPSKQWKKYIKN